MTRLLSAYLEKYSLSPVFTEEEVEHYLTPVEDVVDSYVVESAGQPVISLFIFGLNSVPSRLLLGLCHSVRKNWWHVMWLALDSQPSAIVNQPAFELPSYRCRPDWLSQI